MAHVQRAGNELVRHDFPETERSRRGRERSNAERVEEVREEAMGIDGRISVNTMLDELNRFLVGVDNIWAQGPAFDIVILENLYRQLGKPVPWNYYTIRDSRTLLKALGDTRIFDSNSLHNALADSINQVVAIQTAVAKYKLTEL